MDSIKLPLKKMNKVTKNTLHGEIIPEICPNVISSKEINIYFIPALEEMRNEIDIFQR